MGSLNTKKDKFYLKSGTVNKNISYGSNISVGSSMVNKMHPCSFMFAMIIGNSFDFCDEHIDMRWLHHSKLIDFR